jgi:hypothetical protein
VAQKVESLLSMREALVQSPTQKKENKKYELENISELRLFSIFQKTSHRSMLLFLIALLRTSFMKDNALQ